MRSLLQPSLVLCTLLAIPALATRGEDDAELRARLSRTQKELDDLEGLRRRLGAKDAGAIGELIARTEVAPADSIEAEVELVALRTRVAALQEIIDTRALESGQTPPASRGGETTLAATAAAAHAAPKPAQVEPTVAPSPTTKVSFEVDGFVADNSRLGRACWRGGRYLEGVAALEPQAGDPRCDYWRARCLEKLARSTEALQLYRRVIEVAGASPEGRSAREDLEFLEWSLAHGLVKP